MKDSARVLSTFTAVWNLFCGSGADRSGRKERSRLDWGRNNLSTTYYVSVHGYRQIRAKIKTNETNIRLVFAAVKETILQNVFNTPSLSIYASFPEVHAL